MSIETKRLVEKDPKLKPDDLIVIGGGGGFIGGALARDLARKGFRRIRAADKKPLPEWYQRVPGVECLNLDLSVEDNCKGVCEGAVVVYTLAADMEAWASSSGFVWNACAACSSTRT